MRIGLNLTDLIPGKIGGMEYYMRALVEFLPQIDNRHSFFVFCLKNGSKKIETPKGVKKIALPNPPNRQSLSVDLRKEIINHKITVWLSPLLILDPLPADIPKAFTIPDMQHEYFPEFFDTETLKWRRRYYQLSALAADLIFTISEDSKKDIVNFLGVPPEKVTVTYLDADPMFNHVTSADEIQSVRKKYSLPKEFLFFPANTWPHKNHLCLIKAFGVIANHHPDLELLFTGHPSNAHCDLERAITAHPHKNRIRFLGFAPKSDLPAIYRQASALVFPSLFEGFGIPAVEAMKSDCPMILSHSTSLPEIAGEAALYCNPLNPEDLAAKIEELLGSKELREKLKQAGRKRAQLFSYRETARLTLESLQKLVNRSAPKTGQKKSTTPKISIITPSYNQGEFLEDTIKSVLNQKYENLEYIIMDGGSTDESPTIIKKYAAQYPNIIKWFSGKDEGQTDAINKGLEMATGEIIAWLNSDDIYAANAFKSVVDFFQNHPQAEFIHGIGHHIAKNGEFIEEYPSQPTDFAKLHQRCQICQPTAFWRRSLLTKIGLLDDKLNYCMDYDFWIRAAQVSPLNFVPAHLASTRFYAETKTLGEKQKVFYEAMKITKKYYDRVHPAWILGYSNAIHEKNLKHGRKLSEITFRLKLFLCSIFYFLKYNRKIGRAELKTINRWLKDALIIFFRS